MKTHFCTHTLLNLFWQRINVTLSGTFTLLVGIVVIASNKLEIDRLPDENPKTAQNNYAD